ncbi:glycerol-3-phosphate acyltransferase [Aggregatibacter actinomycetemcomitans serotype e str. SC936]|uniref:glycerol-3-phosphate 1-O-acyltransferase PlsB n=1 Tax=Aggregatibacter actinomycetemcomitans TaxID=714 RepID=UPI00077E795B|nr:glycerol-3-phosphate 1-O-acyltransferase PlsB [Aggregatibacter actinomycetemcomitans]KYK75388.1 glycerol-3-phosphate acyltransferase [Aggregatibacter actinomycetemcomitans serotype e str. SA3096]KYK81213.1 glycerol-3-phosphate acyltransferase [Aggregatibacter actinomycetemcomitans serotype e str. SC936]KYK96601.1 glycerol-3-phosphate acyltransferase [Aggregatibacter actinomycetemcomitans serotype e str. ANH9776]TYB20965.1 glycerol-3-phosphate 1-O-acyltransferase PlsB [Aggregatibacter actinom
MAAFLNAYRKLLELPLSILVKNNPIPHNPIEELELDTSQPIVYVLPYTSETDFVIFRKNCLSMGLPDPLEQNEINGNFLPRFVFLDEGRRFFKSKGAKKETTAIFNKYLELHRTSPQLDVQLIPVSVLWGRAPGREDKSGLPNLRLLNGLQKTIAALWFGRDTFVRFSQAVSLRYMAREHGFDQKIAQKLARVAKMHFAKQRISATGPRLPNRQAMFNKLLQQPVILAAIEDEAKSKNISVEKARKEAEKILDEIAANVSYEGLRVADRFLRWLWNKLYQGIEVENADRVRKLALEGHEIVYVPCHRSHIDYLLLSYVLYHQGLVPPHIAAGINLNFWPVGGMFRRGGAFFIRRTFKGNRLYSTIFREYLAELFHRGYSVEYFIEGGRSRTGRLLAPKTGMMSMTLQALQQQQSRSITVVPVYVGYEHVLEVDTYAKELRGAAKEKENAGLVLRVIKKLRNLGKGYVNFGEPITLSNYLNQHFPEWKEPLEDRPQWFNKAVDAVSNQVMVNINKAAAVNAMNLTGTALLSSRQRALSREQLLEQLSSYQQFLQNVPYSDDVVVPTEKAEIMLDHVLSLDRVGILPEKDNFGEIVRLERSSAVLMTYYRNNIQHLFVVPSLVANIVLHYEAIQQNLVLEAVLKIYPFLRSELFLHFTQEQLAERVEQIIAELQRQNIIKHGENMLAINKPNIRMLQLWSAGVREILQRYYITVNLLQNNPLISRANLEKESQSVAQRLSVLHGINAPEFFDKAVFSAFTNSLKEQGYFNESGTANTEKLQELADILTHLISTEICLTINGAVTKIEEKELEES